MITRHNRPYYAASSQELDVFGDPSASDNDILAVQNRLADRIMDDAGQGYTDDPTFQAVMWGTILDARSASESHQGHRSHADFVSKLGRYAHVADEPFAMSYTSGELTYLGFLRRNNRAASDDARIYSVRALEEAAWEFRGTPEGAFWGQAFVRTFEVGAKHWWIDRDWRFEGTHELGVVMRSKTAKLGKVLSLRDFEYPLGMPAMRQHFHNHGEQTTEHELDRLVAQARHEYGFHLATVPGDDFPPINDR